MKKYAALLLPLAAICIAGTLAIQGIALVVVALSSDGIGRGMPMRFYEMLKLPIFSVALPILGMLLFAACLPALRRSKPAPKPNLLGAPPRPPARDRKAREPHYKTA